MNSRNISWNENVVVAESAIAASALTATTIQVAPVAIQKSKKWFENFRYYYKIFSLSNNMNGCRAIMGFIRNNQALIKSHVNGPVAPSGDDGTQIVMPPLILKILFELEKCHIQLVIIRTFCQNVQFIH